MLCWCAFPALERGVMKGFTSNVLDAEALVKAQLDAHMESVSRIITASFPPYVAPEVKT